MLFPNHCRADHNCNDYERAEKAERSYFMKRVICIILISVFCVFTISGVVLAAVVDVDTVADYYFEDYESLPQDFKDLCNAYINYFNSLGSLTVTFSDMTQIPKSWFKVLGDGVFALSPVDDLIYYLADGQLMVADRHGGAGGHHRAEETLPVVSSDDFKDLVDDRKKDLKFYPTGNTGKASIKTDITYSAADYDSVRTADYFTFLANKTFFGFDGLSECYVVPFVESEGMEYFSNYCYKLELDIVRNDGHGNSAITALRIKKVDMDSFDTSSDYDSYSAAFDLEENLYKSTNSNTFYGEPVLNVFQSNPYGTFRFSSNMGLIIALSGLSDYYSHANGRYSLQYWDLDFFKPNFRSSDLVLGTTISASSIARTSTDFKHPVGELTKDFGFFVSTSPIQMLGFAADIDTQKIPDNYYITVEGDTIYDYTITDPATGQGDTINNYVTNNYTFVTDPGGESSGGSVDGNVTVGGQIDVSGSVDVGVDVNVNINGGAGGTGSLPDVNVDTNPLDNYLNSAIEDSSGIRQFFGSFFDFVPPEILVLLGIGLTFVIMGRILGR